MLLLIAVVYYFLLLLLSKGWANHSATHNATSAMLSVLRAKVEDQASLLPHQRRHNLRQRDATRLHLCGFVILAVCDVFWRFVTV